MNVPPDRRGLINEHDSAALMGFKELRDEAFGKDLVNNAKVLGLDSVSKIEVNFTTETKLNCIVLEEPIQLGQRVKSFSILLKNKNELVKEIKGTTIGKKR